MNAQVINMTINMSSVRDVTSVETFKKILKTFLFRKAFGDRFTLIKF